MKRDELSEAISQAVGASLYIAAVSSVAGGCINQAHRISDGDQSFFIKLNRIEWLEMFRAEADGLRAMQATASVRVPEVICHGISGKQAYLVLEDIALQALDAGSQQQLGAQLAVMHRSSAEQFGWHRDNTIGSTPQFNTRMADWLSFFMQQRLAPQLEWAAAKGLVILGAERLAEVVERLFESYAPIPALLHGDLWSGNAAMDTAGNPVLFDPACYYGDREVDIAFTEMFGGFEEGFYRAYDQAWPLDAGYSQRKHFYNLYHVLNHFNLFGGSYGSQAKCMVADLLAE